MKRLFCLVLLSFLFLSPVVAGPGNSKFKQNTDEKEKRQFKIKVIDYGGKARIFDYAAIEVVDIKPTCFFRLYTTDGHEFFAGSRTGATKADLERLIKKIQNTATVDSVEIAIKFFSSAYPSTWGSTGILEKTIYKLESINVKNIGSLDIRKAMQETTDSLVGLGDE